MKLFHLQPAAILLAALAIANAQPAKPPAKTPEQLAWEQLAKLRDKPPEYVDALIKFARDFPDTNQAESTVFRFRDVFSKDASAEQLHPLIRRMIDGLATLPAPLRVRLYGDFARTLSSRNFWPETVEVAQKAIAMLDENAYLEESHRRFLRDQAIRKKMAPDAKPREYQPAQEKNRFVGFEANLYASLGQGYFGLGKLDEAATAYRKSQDIKKTTESAWGLGEIAEKLGKPSEAIPYFTQALLTGKLKAPQIEHFRKLYASLNPDGADSFEAHLDAAYRKDYRNPVPIVEREPVRTRSDRTVLAEFVTGAGCVPCMPFDYSFERMLEEYTRRDLVLLVYDWHAPNIDPLGNHGSDNRVKYYKLNSAPNVFIDGKRLVTEHDNSDETGIEATAPKVHHQLIATIAPRLETKAGAKLEGTAELTGGIVKVSLAASELEKPKATLHIALIEDPVTYSGENGLRFHPMVMRNLARADKIPTYGFPLESGKPQHLEYAFDLKKIEAENLRYYDEYPEERRNEIRAEGRAAILSFITFEWREQRNLIDPRHVAVAAFVQDDGTKEILQAVFIPVKNSADRAAIGR